MWIWYQKNVFLRNWKFSFSLHKLFEITFVENVECTNRYQWYNGIGSFICLYMTWKKWSFIHKFPPMEIILNIWWKSLHRNSRYCQNHQNGVTSCFPKMVVKMKKKLYWFNKIWNVNYYLKKKKIEKPYYS